MNGDGLYLKALGTGRRAPMGVGSWPRNGAWTERRTPRICESGWHACRNTLDLLGFLNAELYVVKLDGRIVEGDNKVAAERARIVRRLPWDDKTARLYACDVAERVLPIFEKHHPNDVRPRRAIDTARRYVNGDATYAELAAARDAAGTAARDAAGTAARDAAGTAARTAARDAAWAAARDAARAAAGAAARDAERQWQSRRLAEVLGIADTQFDGSLREGVSS